MCQEMHAGAVRYTMLVPIHAYAQEQLQAHGELEELQQRHALFFADWAEGIEACLQGAEQLVWLERLEHEHTTCALPWNGHSSMILRWGCVWRARSGISG